MSTSTVSSYTYSDDFEFQRIMGQPDRHASFREVCEKHIPASSRPQPSILGQVGKDASLKAYLVYYKTIICGLLIYKKERDPQKKINIYCIQPVNVEKTQGQDIRKAMLQSVLAEAKDMSCSSLHCLVNERDEEGKRFFKENLFTSSTINERLFTRSLPQAPETLPQPVNQNEDFSRKRPREERSIVLPPSKKLRTDSQPKPLDVTLKEPYLSYILQGRKTVEGRIASGMFSSISTGSRIRFFNQRNSVICKVRAVNRYPSFEKMLQAEGVAACLPNTSSLQNAVRIYDNLPGYTERARRSGVLGIQIEREIVKE